VVDQINAGADAVNDTGEPVLHFSMSAPVTDTQDPDFEVDSDDITERLGTFYEDMEFEQDEAVAYGHELEDVAQTAKQEEHDVQRQEAAVRNEAENIKVSEADFAAEPSGGSEVVDDVVEGAQEAPVQIVGAVIDAIKQTGQALVDMGLGMAKRPGSQGALGLASAMAISGHDTPESFEAEMRKGIEALPTTPDAKTWTGAFIRHGTRMGLQFVAGSKAAGAVGATKLYLKGMAGGVVLDAGGQSVDEDNLAAMSEQLGEWLSGFDPESAEWKRVLHNMSPLFNNAITKYIGEPVEELENGAAEKRFRNALDGLVAEALIGTVVAVAKGMNAFVKNKGLLARIRKEVGNFLRDQEGALHLGPGQAKQIVEDNDTRLAMQFYSPILTEEQTTADALKFIGSDNHKLAGVLVRNVDEQLGLSASNTQAAVGDWASPKYGSGSEASFVTTVSGSKMRSLQDTFNLFKLSAAIKGRLLNQRSVIVFVEGEGKEATSRVHDAFVPSGSGSIEQIKAALSEAGIEGRTLVPEAGGTRIYVFDEDGSRGDTFKTFVNAYEGIGDYGVRSGMGEEFGAKFGEPRSAARAVYEKEEEALKLATNRSYREIDSGGEGAILAGSRESRELFRAAQVFRDRRDGVIHLDGIDAELVVKRTGKNGPERGLKKMNSKNANALADAGAFSFVATDSPRKGYAKFNEWMTENVPAWEDINHEPTRKAIHKKAKASFKKLAAMAVKGHKKRLNSLEELNELYLKGESNSLWYVDAQSAIKSFVVKGHENIFTAFFAATSNMADPAANVGHAIEVYLKFLAGEPILQGDFKSTAAEAIAKASNKIIEAAKKGGLDTDFSPFLGPKTMPFYKNLGGDLNYSTNDVWQGRAHGWLLGGSLRDAKGNVLKRTKTYPDGSTREFNKTGPAPTTAQHNFMEASTKYLARQNGVAPAVQQAGMWAGIKMLLDKKGLGAVEDVRKTLVRIATEHAQRLEEFVPGATERLAELADGGMKLGLMVLMAPAVLAAMAVGDAEASEEVFTEKLNEDMELQGIQVAGGAQFGKMIKEIWKKIAPDVLKAGQKAADMGRRATGATQRLDVKVGRAADDASRKYENKPIEGFIERRKMEAAAREDAKRGTQSIEETTHKALNTMMTDDEIKALYPGSTRNVEEVTAMRFLIARQINKLGKSADDLLAGMDSGDMSQADTMERFESFLVDLWGLGTNTNKADALISEAGREMRFEQEEFVAGAKRFMAQFRAAVDDPTSGMTPRKLLLLFKELKTDSGKVAFVTGITKPGMLDILLEYWMGIGLLSGPRTQLRNFIGNGSIAVVRPIETAIAARLPGKFAGTIARGEAMAEAYGWWAMQGSALKAMALAWRTREAGAAFDILAPGTKSTAATKLGTVSRDIVTRENFPKLGYLADIYGATARLSFRALVSVDEYNKAAMFGAAIHKEAWSRAIIEEGLTGDAAWKRMEYLVLHAAEEMPNAIKAAKMAAVDGTFQAPLGPIAKALQEAAKEQPLLRLMVPFIVAPTNVIKQQLRRTPLALASKNFRDELAGKVGATPRDKARNAQTARAQQAFGAVILTTGAMLAYKGMINGNGPGNHRIARTWRQNHMAHAAYMGTDKQGKAIWMDTNNTMIGDIMTMWADVVQMVDFLPEDEETTQYLTDVAGALLTLVAKNVPNKTFTKGTAEWMSAMTNPTDPRTGAGPVLSRFLTSFFPAAAAQANQEWNTTAMLEVRDFIDGIKAKTWYYNNDYPTDEGLTPEWIASHQDFLPPRRESVFGWRVDMVTGGPMKGYFSPLGVRRIEKDAVYKELERLKLSFNPPRRSFSGVKLSRWEYDSMVRLTQSLTIPLKVTEGKSEKTLELNLHELLTRLVASREYLILPSDDFKKQFIRSEIESARSRGMATYFSNNESLMKKLKNDTEKVQAQIKAARETSSAISAPSLFGGRGN